ncbi:MAG: cobalamin-binding protein [Halioglobus sp.]
MYRFLIAMIAIVCSTQTTAGPRVIDSLGREVTLEKPAESIIGLAPHIVENLYSAGAGEKLIGAVSYSDYPEEATALPQVGSAYAWSLESVVALAPDLVVLWGSGNGSSALSQLERLGITVYVSEPRTIADIADSIRDFGTLAGTEANAEQSAARFEHVMETLQADYQRDNKLRVFYQIWNKPLQTINGEHMISQVIELCGGINVFESEAQLAPRISLESVLDINPDAIVASGMGKARPEWLDDWKQYGSLRAVQQGALLHVHPDLIQRPTVRIAQGATDLCSQLDHVRTELP